MIVGDLFEVTESYGNWKKGQVIKLGKIDYESSENDIWRYIFCLPDQVYDPEIGYCCKIDYLKPLHTDYYIPLPTEWESFGYKPDEFANNRCSEIGQLVMIEFNDGTKELGVLAEKTDNVLRFSDIEGRPHHLMVSRLSSSVIIRFPRPLFSYRNKKYIKPNQTSSTNQTTMNNDVKNFIINEDLDENSKALIETGLEDPSGVPTQEGKDALSAMIWKERRDDLAKKAKAMLAASKKEKADKKK